MSAKRSIAFFKLSLPLCNIASSFPKRGKRVSPLEAQRAESSVGRGRLHPAMPVEGDGRSPATDQGGF
ncbi:MAG: hypothetical protein HZA13_01985 [Nitrospirae bacterium]|nr:hypothetical protein [Nitrospirota bacterium]